MKETYNTVKTVKVIRSNLEGTQSEVDRVVNLLRLLGERKAP